MRNTFLFHPFLFLLLCSSCQKDVPAAPRGAPVEIGVVTVQNVPQQIKGVGQLIPSLTVDLKAQVGGILTNVLFTDGQRVEEGDLLMTIDPRIYETQLDEANAQLGEDEAKLRYALDFAKTYGKLVSNDYVSRLDYEKGVQNVQELQATVALDQANIKKAEINLGFTQLRAPFKGYLGRRTFDPGNYVEAGADKGLVTLNKITPLSIQFYISSDFVQEIREMQQISPLHLEAELPTDPGHPLEGTLWFIDNTVNSETGLIMLKGTIPNEDERGWPGQFVRVYLRLKTLENAVLVPKQAIVLGETGNFVYVLDEEKMRVKMRMIGKGIVYRDSCVVLWGLNGGEKIVLDGQLNLHDNALVYIPDAKKK